MAVKNLLINLFRKDNDLYDLDILLKTIQNAVIISKHNTQKTLEHYQEDNTDKEYDKEYFEMIECNVSIKFLIHKKTKDRVIIDLNPKHLKKHQNTTSSITLKIHDTLGRI